MLLHRSSVKKFRFTDCRFDFSTMSAVLSYAFDDSVFFQETFAFKNVPDLAKHDPETVNALVRLLHLAAGVSYYKAFLPEQIVVENTELSKEEALFFKNFYEKGLGEFSFRNKVAVRVDFDFNPVKETKKTIRRLPQKTVVPVGGGKDSIVTLETLKQAGFDPTCICVNRPRAIKETIEQSGCPFIEIERKISPELIRINEQSETNGALNGHVPVTGILAFALALAAALYDFSDVCMSCERSANVGNTAYDGKIVNHQWSKSLEFERDFQNLINSVLSNFRYFSFLRPLSELSIAKNFAAIRKYDSVFTSCNRAFRLDEGKRIDYWCGACDKCRFVFLSLAPFMSKERLINIFKSDPLDDEKQISGYKQLLGLEAFKPFECVGEIEESVCAFDMIRNLPEWREDCVVKALSSAELPSYDKNGIFSLTTEHCVPKEYQNAFNLFKK